MIINGADVNTSVKFTKKVTTYYVTTDVQGNGYVTGGGAYQEGATCKLYATAEGIATFVGWYIDQKQVSTNPSYSFTVSKDIFVRALFSAR